ncbi:MAG TPA: alpha/beta hydrolase fold domain-containing protein [Acetobacteraceae bacterium]|nr:alpha/beta hydrolase fold domain-containing protein [Acetobacteraceae bacterium]
MTDDALRAGALQVDEDGTVHVPAHLLPLSAALSDHTRATMAAALHRTPRMGIPRAEHFTSEAEFTAAVDAFRVNVDMGYARPMSERLAEAFPVRMSHGRIGGVPVEEFAPLDGMDNERVLINLHGGAFCSGATYVGRIESIPMANLGKFRVVSVDYRQGYEHKYPAASEDIAAVYAALLKTYAPGRIGIYGGSAGGVLTAQATAWILEHGLPAPGAIGIFGAGSGGYGDSDYFAAIGMGQMPPLGLLGSRAGASVGYFSHASDDDPLVNPNIAPASFRARFPPALLMTGTRAFDMSPAIATHRALVQAGVDASLHVFDGVGHCFYYDASAPEGADAYQTIVRFFWKRLKTQKRLPFKGEEATTCLIV